MEKKLNNLLSFEDFDKNWKPDEQKKTKRTEIGMDIVKETNLIINADPNLKKLSSKTIKFLKKIKPMFDDNTLGGDNIMGEIDDLIEKHKELTKNKKL